MAWAKIDKSTMLLIEVNAVQTNPDPNAFLEVETTETFADGYDYRWNSQEGKFYNVGLKPEIINPESQIISPFASKELIKDGVKYKIYTRVHGVCGTAIAGQTTNIDFVVPYEWCKMTEMEIMNCSLGDIVNLTVHDDANNTYSGLDPATYGANLQLNQFGFDVRVPDGTYFRKSKYDANLWQGVIVRVSYTNNGTTDKDICFNIILHELKK